MPTSDAYNKTDRLHQIQLLFWNNPGKRLRTSEIAVKLEVSEDTALRYLTELPSTGRLPVNPTGCATRYTKSHERKEKKDL